MCPLCAASVATGLLAGTFGAAAAVAVLRGQHIPLRMRREPPHSRLDAGRVGSLLSICHDQCESHEPRSTERVACSATIQPHAGVKHHARPGQSQIVSFLRRRHKDARLQISCRIRFSSAATA